MRECFLGLLTMLAMPRGDVEVSCSRRIRGNVKIRKAMQLNR